MSRSHLLVLLAAVCFGTTGTAQALGPDSAGPLSVGAVRIAIGAVFLLVAMRLAGGRVPGGRDRVPLAVAAVGIAAYQLCFFAAVRETGVAIGTVVALGSAPAITGALAWLVEGIVPRPAWVVATLLATAGVAFMALAGGGTAEVSVPGVLLALGAGASYAVFALGSKRLLDSGHRIESVMASAFTAGAVLLLPVLVVSDLGWLREPGGIAMALWLGAVPTALAYLLFGAGLRHLRAGDVATLTLAEPITATILGVLVLGERPGPTALVGMVLIFIGLAALAFDRPDRAADADLVAPG